MTTFNIIKPNTTPGCTTARHFNDAGKLLTAEEAKDRYPCKIRDEDSLQRIIECPPAQPKNRLIVWISARWNLFKLWFFCKFFQNDRGFIGKEYKP